MILWCYDFHSCLRVHTSAFSSWTFQQEGYSQGQQSNQQMMVMLASMGGAASNSEMKPNMHMEFFHWDETLLCGSVQVCLGRGQVPANSTLILILETATRIWSDIFQEEMFPLPVVSHCFLKQRPPPMSFSSSPSTPSPPGQLKPVLSLVYITWITRELTWSILQ